MTILKTLSFAFTPLFFHAERKKKTVTHAIWLLVVPILTIYDVTYAALADIPSFRFCMETTTDTGNLSRNEKWLVEIRSYEFREKKSYTHTCDKKIEKQSSELYVFNNTYFSNRTISVFLS